MARGETKPFSRAMVKFDRVDKFLADLFSEKSDVEDYRRMRWTYFFPLNF